jgi:hypothetical protein
VIKNLVIRGTPFKSVGGLITRGLGTDSGDTANNNNRRRIVLSVILKRRGRR